MTDISHLTRYLPPVLWASENDPQRFLGRMLRVFEKMMIGIEVGSVAVRARAPISGATGTTVTFVNPDDALLFRTDDVITIESGSERRAVSTVGAGAIGLNAPLAGVYGADVIRIADLEAGQTTFRVDNLARLEVAVQLDIRQGETSEAVEIAAIDDHIVTLNLPLVNDYPMSDNALPIRLVDRPTVDFKGIDQGDFKRLLDRRNRLFNPWTTRSELLPYIAGWLALVLREDWSEYQKRYLTAAILEVYQNRGLKAGTHRFLDIYAVTQAKPRIALDDGEALLRTIVKPNGCFDFSPICFSRFIATGIGTASFLLHPSAVVLDSSEQIFVADIGDESDPDRKPAIYNVSHTGEIPHAGGTLPMPKPIAIHQPPLNPLTHPVALAADIADRIAVIDRGNVIPPATPDSAIYRFTPPTYGRSVIISQSTVPSLPVVNPIDMALNSKGAFAILDRGFHALGDPPAGPTAPKITIVSEGPLSVVNHMLPSVQEPSAMAVDELDRYIVADARDQFSNQPARLWLVDPAAAWAQTDLLAALPAVDNPLVFPKAIFVESPGVYLVADTGLSWGYDPLDPEGADPSYRYRAEQATLYRVNTNMPIPLITRLTLERRLVTPTDMAVDGEGQIFVTDAGEKLKGTPDRNWRARTNEFGAVLHFSRQRPISWSDRLKVRRNIAEILFSEKPAASKWWMDI